MKLPKSVQEIADVIGDELALYLVGQLPRCYARDPRWPNAKSSHVILYVPTSERLTLDHELVRILGWNDAVKLCRAFGGEILQPAECAGIYRDFRDKNIWRLVMEGTPVGIVAEWFGVSERHVKNLMRENPQEERRAANDNNTAVQHPKRRADDKPAKRQRSA
jgi:hypothetical protein